MQQEKPIRVNDISERVGVFVIKTPQGPLVAVESTGHLTPDEAAVLSERLQEAAVTASLLKERQ